MFAELFEAARSAQGRYLAALAVLGAFLALAKLADLFIDRILRRLAARSSFELDDEMLALLHRPVWQTIVLYGVRATVALMEAPGRVAWATAALTGTLMVIIWAVALLRVLHLVFGTLQRRLEDASELSREMLPFLENLSRIVVGAAALLVALSLWEVDITPLLASAGIAGVAVALAAKDTLANVFGGISVFLDRPYRLGDYIVLDSGERGEVVMIGARSTRIKTRDDITVSVPNAVIANAKIVNESAPVPRFRVRVAVGVAYGSDIDLVERVLLECAGQVEGVSREPAPRVRFRAFGDSSLDFELLCWAEEPSLRGLVIHQLNRAIYHAFARHGITIPFPQRDLHLVSAAAGVVGVHCGESSIKEG